jgi:hypothetical protein
MSERKQSNEIYVLHVGREREVLVTMSLSSCVSITADI